MIETIQQKIEHKLSAGNLNEFTGKAALMGHSEERILQNEEVTTYFKLNTFESARAVLSSATDEQCKIRLSTFFNPSLLNRSRLGQGKHDRGEAVAFANAPVSETDSKGINRHFPVRVKGISVLHKVVTKGETWDVSVTGEFWGIDEMEELYTVLNVGTLVLEEDAKVVIRGNVFSMLCQQLICHDSPSPYSYQIGILPTPYSVDFGHGPHNGPHGIEGRSGSAGINGRALGMHYSILGPIFADEENTTGLDGTNGEDGRPGTDGVKGRNGGMCKLAEITIRNLAGKLTVFSQAGAGGYGGNGGNGGDGGNGGNAMPGQKGFNKIVYGGKAGNSGNGGDGGDGGNAGHGGIASNIYLRVPEEAIPGIEMKAYPSLGGLAGNGGKAGIAGVCGEAPTAEDTALNSEMGTTGINGTDGKDGQNGRSRASANLYLNDFPYHELH